MQGVWAVSSGDSSQSSDAGFPVVLRISRPPFSSLPSPAESRKHAIAGFQLHDLVQETHSLAFFPRAALLNHSCAPCCSMFYEKDATGRVFAHVVCSAAKRVRLSIIAQKRHRWRCAASRRMSNSQYLMDHASATRETCSFRAIFISNIRI